MINMRPRPDCPIDSRPDAKAGIRRKRTLLAATAAGAATLAAASLPLLLAVPVALLTTLVATAVGISSRLITIDHG